MDHEHDETMKTARPEPTTGATPVARLDEFYLARLRRFSGLAADAEVPAMRALARHAALSAYRDCAARGLHDEAQRVLDAARIDGSVDRAA
jgi:hypothetical protein